MNVEHFSYSPMINNLQQNTRNISDLQPPQFVNNTIETQPPLKKIKWGNDAGDEEISPETDKMVEEELCSFLSTIEASKAKECSTNISPHNFACVDLDSSHNNFGGIERNSCVTPTVTYTQEDHLDHSFSPILPLDINRSTTGKAFSTPKIPHQSPFSSFQMKPSSVEFKTPKNMQLITSLDDPSDLSLSPPQSASRPVFKVPMTTRTFKRPQRQPLATFTRTPTTVDSAKLFKKVSFGSSLIKSDEVCEDTGYGSSPISKVMGSTEVTANKESERLANITKEAAEETRRIGEAVRETVTKKGLKIQPPSEVDHELLREGWDQLATFIYCYNILRELGKFPLSIFYYHEE